MRNLYFMPFSKSLSLGTMMFCAYASFSQCTSIIDVDFDNHSNKIYTVEDAKNDFNNKLKPWTASTYRGLSGPGASSNLIEDTPQETRIENGTLKAEYLKDDASGRSGGFLFDSYFDAVDEAYLEYKVKFDENFFWATGGKLPGLGGSTSGINSETTGRGTIPSGCKYNADGWSARLMWRRNRQQTDTPYLILYSYFAEKTNGQSRTDGDCGDAKKIFTGLNGNTWYTIRQYIKMNTPGQNDGVVTMWVNEEMVYNDDKALIRNSGKNSLKINALIMNTYRGGSRTDPVWHSPRTEYAFFDDFKVWTGCSTPPGTTNTAPTGEFLNPTFNQIETGYDELYVNVTGEDIDGDDVDVTLKIDGSEIRTERGAPYEFGHNPVDPAVDFTDETRFLSVGDHLFEAIITDSKGASTTISKTITVVEPKGPYSGTPMLIPGTIEMEDYDKGGANVSYKDNDVTNRGGEYRNDQVDITSMEGGLALGWISNGEWLEYTVNVEETADYDMTMFYAANGTNASVGLSSNGTDLLTAFTLPESGGFSNYVTVERLNVSLTEGEQVLRFKVEQNGFNIDKIVFAPSTVTSTNERSSLEALVIYPNPNTSGIFKLTQSVEWKIISTQGVLITQGAGKQIDLSGINKGVYLVQLPSGVAKRIVID